MAKLPAIEIWHKHESCRFDLTVSADGIFSAKLTPDEADELKRLDMDGVSVGENRAGTPILRCTTREALKDALQKYVHWRNERTVKKEAWIAYRFGHKASYVKDKETGEIYKNGSQAPGWGERSNWFANALDATHPAGTYSFGVGGQVWVKLIETDRYGNTAEKWESPVYHKELVTPAMQDLMDFCSIHVPPSPTKELRFGKPKVDAIHLVPYDEDLAVFITDAMMTVCKLADKMFEYFDTPETTMLRAKSGPLKLTHQTTK